MTTRERIQVETERWILTEPLFFAIYCTHRLKINAKMLCALRSGEGRIEYNPDIIDGMKNAELNAMLRMEIIRILLQHPYARKPLGCMPIILRTASDMVISPAYHLAWLNMSRPEKYGLPLGKNYEWYARRLNEMANHQDGDNPSEGDSNSNEQKGEGVAKLPSHGADKDENCTSQHEERNSKQNEGDIKTFSGMNISDGAEAIGVETVGIEPDYKSADDYTALWNEDQFQSHQIAGIVQSTTQWGSIPGCLVELIKKAVEGRIDYRSVLRTFRASILSQKRRLTRMRPSRRFGFDQMGSRYEFVTRLLIAIDTSGSVGTESLGRYFHIITTFFKYGVQEIDVLMFDADIQGKPMKLDEAKKNKMQFEVKGRGGTNFQAPIDYIIDNPRYDGLIIITDGYAPVPEVPPHLSTKLLWVIDNEQSYNQKYNDLRKTGRVCLMQL